MTFSNVTSPIEEIIEEARNGRMSILVDDEHRENEGDLVVPAQMATPETINFMAKFGRGLICLALTSERVKLLGLPLMSRRNEQRNQTAFTVSIEARNGVTTGISAPDRAHSISVAIDPNTTTDDIATPGHVFPLMARDGGVLVRAGHTEAVVDIARLAGLGASGVICEIMNDDGTMARRPDLIKFAQFHGLKMGTIADLIAYRRRYDRTVERATESVLDSRHGGRFRMIVYVNRVAYAEHIVLIKGDISNDRSPLVRMHAQNTLDDILGSVESGKSGELQRAMEIIGAEGRGVVVIIRDPHSIHNPDQIKASGTPLDGDIGPVTGELRDYGVGAQILLDLGIHEMVLLSNTPKTIIGIDGYGLKVVAQRPIPIE